MVLYKAAAFNLLGIVDEHLKQNNAAKDAFNNAMAVCPNFMLAKDNLDNLNKNK